MKKRYLLTLSLLILCSLALSACQIPFVNVSVVRGSGDMKTETREVSGFNQIRLDGAGLLVISQGETESLEIKAEDNILPELTSDVRGSLLVLGTQEGFWKNTVMPTERIVYTLTVKDLQKITVNGAADIEIGKLETSSIEIDFNGAGKISIEDLNAESVDVTIAGTGNVELAGEVDSQMITIAGAGNVKAGDLLTSTTTIEVSGFGNATIWVTETLDVTINGGGSLSYYGTPSVTQDINGAGNITSLGEK